MPHDPLLLATAVEAVVRAGDVQMAHFGRAIEVSKKGRIDLVTEVDVAVEKEFRALVASRFPDHEVLAEEFGAPTGGVRARHCWIFDPLDGTTNYAHGLPIFCSSLALEIDGHLEIGAVYDPSRRELFTAERGGGALLNGEPLRVSETVALLDALLVTGFPYNVHESVAPVVGLFGEFIARAQAVRRLGSAALDLCYVAAGRMDGFWEERLKPWDVAAGALIVQEAGGAITAIDGGPFDVHQASLIASNGRVHGAMLGTVEEFRSRSRCHGFKHGPEVGRYAAARLLRLVKPEPRFSLVTKSELHHREVH
jgi:myo-inositol-1(or 4)-monophosphatase